MIKLSLLALFTSSLCVAACGGGDGGGSGVDASKDLLSLSDSEIESLCEYSVSTSDAAHLKEINCYSQAVFTTQMMGDCETEFEACMAEPDGEEFDCSTAADDMFPDCADQVTVGEMETCFEAQSAATNAISISCSTDPEDINDLFDQEPPAGCQAIIAKCPDLF